MPSYFSVFVLMFLFFNILAAQDHSKKQKKSSSQKHKQQTNEDATYDKLLNILEVIFAKEMLKSGENGISERKAKDLRNMLQPPPPVHPLLPKYQSVAQNVPQSYNFVPFVPNPRTFPQQTALPQYYSVQNTNQIPRAKLAVYGQDSSQNPSCQNQNIPLQNYPKASFVPSQLSYAVANPQVAQKPPCTNVPSNPQNPPYLLQYSSPFYPNYPQLQTQLPQTNCEINNENKAAMSQINEAIDNIDADIGDTIMVLYKVKSGMVTQHVGSLFNQLPTKVLEPFYVSKIKN